jgi:transposase
MFSVQWLIEPCLMQIIALNRNDEKWPHTRQIEIAGRNHILPPLGIAW